MRIFAIALALALGACATKYQPVGLTGGFQETKLNADTYEITAGGNGYTSRERVRDIALLRASELTLAEGAERFVVLSGEVSTRYAGSTPVTADKIGNTIIVSGGDPIQRPVGSLLIRIVRSKTDPLYNGALDAALIDSQLRPRLT